MNKINKFFEKKSVAWIALALIIAVSLGIIINVFVTQKEGLHSDEIWSYGLANSYYKPFIYGPEMNKFDIDRVYTGDEFFNYITVQDDERFSYDSVFYNQSLDVHPPLYYCIINTISSFFPNTYSRWYSFSINIAAFVASGIVLFLLAKRLFKSNLAALSVCFLWCFCTGTVECFIYLRMYALETTLILLTLLLHTAMFQEDNFKKYLPFIFLTTAIGGLNNFTFLVFAGALSGCFCFYYLFSKKIKKLFIYAFTMLGSVGAVIAAFPATLTILTTYESNSSDVFDPLMKFRVIMMYALSDIFGIKTSLSVPLWWTDVTVVIICLVALAIPLSFLFRNEKWFQPIKSAVKNIPSSIKKLGGSIKDNFSEKLFIPLCMIVSVSASLLLVTFTVSVELMSYYTTRYIFSVYAVIILLTALIVFGIFSKIKWTKKINCIILAVLCIVSAAINPPNYKYTFPLNATNGTISDYVNGNDAILVLDGYYVWRLTCYSDILTDADNIYVSTANTYTYNLDEISSFAQSDEMYLIAESGHILTQEEYEKSKQSGMTDEQIFLNGRVVMEDDFLNTFFDNTKYTKAEKLTKETIFALNVTVYRLSEE